MTDILNQIDESIARNAVRFDPFGEAWDDNRVDQWGDGMRVRPAVVAEEDGSAPICRGCRSVPSEPSSFGRLCAACFDTEACSNERTNALNNRRMTCIRPAGHAPPCEEGHPAGSQWYATGPMWFDETHTFNAEEFAAGGVVSTGPAWSGGDAATPSPPVADVRQSTAEFLRDAAAFQRFYLNERVASTPAAPPVDAASEPDPEEPTVPSLGRFIRPVRICVRRILPGGTR